MYLAATPLEYDSRGYLAFHDDPFKDHPSLLPLQRSALSDPPTKLHFSFNFFLHQPRPSFIGNALCQGKFAVTRRIDSEGRSFRVYRFTFYTGRCIESSPIRELSRRFVDT